MGETEEIRLSLLELKRPRLYKTEAANGNIRFKNVLSLIDESILTRT